MNHALQVGDILIFKAGDDWIGKSIAWLTDSDVSHSAMVYEEDSLVEMGPSGISVNKMMISPGDHAHVMRLAPGHDADPLIHAADVYITAQTRYDFPALVLLAGLLIYRRIRPTHRFVKIADLILRMACKEVDELIQKLILHNPDKAMVCSQLVYQIYRDCGKEYEIHIKGGDLQNNLDNVDGSVRLIDLLSEASSHIPGNIYQEEDGMLPPDRLARELYEAMRESAENTFDSARKADVEPLLDTAGKLLEMLERFLEISGSALPINALFITPSDIAYHATNLVEVQTIDVQRIK